VCFAADDPNLGTWKLNEAKSKINAGSPKNTMVVYAAVGDKIHCNVDGVDANGKPAHNEWTGKFDGKDYPVTGDPTSDTRSMKKIDAHTYSLAVKKGGTVTTTARVAFSADGKTRTLTTNSTDANGKKVSNTSVFEKQ
jgi:hypothetical protein